MNHLFLALRNILKFYLITFWSVMDKLEGRYRHTWYLCLWRLPSLVVSSKSPTLLCNFVCGFIFLFSRYSQKHPQTSLVCLVNPSYELYLLVFCKVYSSLISFMFILVEIFCLVDVLLGTVFVAICICSWHIIVNVECVKYFL